MRRARSTEIPLSAGRSGCADDREVEDVPGIAKEGEAVDEKLGADLDDEDGESEEIDRLQERASLVHGGR